MKQKTNRQIMTKAIKELSDLDLVFLRERLLAACEEVVDNAAEIREQNQNSLINPNLMIDACVRIKEKIDY